MSVADAEGWHCTHGTSLAVSSTTVWTTPAAWLCWPPPAEVFLSEPIVTWITGWSWRWITSERTGSLTGPACLLTRMPSDDDDSLLWMWSTRSWSWRSRSANDGGGLAFAAQVDAAAGEHGPRWRYNGTQVPLCGGITVISLCVKHC